MERKYSKQRIALKSFLSEAEKKCIQIQGLNLSSDVEINHKMRGTEGYYRIDREEDIRDKNDKATIGEAR